MPDPSVGEVIDALRQLSALVAERLREARAKARVLNVPSRHVTLLESEAVALALAEEEAPAFMARRARPPGVVEVLLTEEEASGVVVHLAWLSDAIREYNPSARARDKIIAARGRLEEPPSLVEAKKEEE